MALLTIAAALNQALHQEMERDKSVLVMGEDVGLNGGVFRITDGLYKNLARNALSILHSRKPQSSARQ